MSQPATLPPLRITLLCDVPDFDRSPIQNTCEAKINWALRYLHSFNKRQERILGDYVVHIYRSTTTTPSLAQGLEDEDSDEEVGAKQSPEYLIFLFNQTLGSHVYTLSTPKAFKVIRPFCSHHFPSQYYDHYTGQLSSIDKVSLRQLFSPVAESTLMLKGQLLDKVNQETQVYRQCRAVYRAFPSLEGSDIKIEFSERSVLIYRDLTLLQYAQLLGQLPTTNRTVASLRYAGLPENSLVALPQNSEGAIELENIACCYIAGLSHYHPHGYKFNLSLSDKWCSKGYRFRLHFHGPQSAFPLTNTEKDTPLTLENVWQRPSTHCSPDQVRNGMLSLEYKTTSNQWFTMPILDCIEGCVTNPSGQLFFKIDRAWYQIASNHVESTNKQLSAILAQPGLVLRLGEKGHLNLQWDEKTPENDYNRSYTTENTYPRKWYDGNLKRLLNFELFDILQIDEEDVFIYHVKKKFDTSAKVAGAQLLSSAQIIQGYRNRSSNHPDMVKLVAYCNRVGGDSSHFLYKALLYGKLHFVLAFSFMGEPVQEMLEDNSLSAKHETIKTREAICLLNKEFQFHIGPIQAAQTGIINIPGVDPIKITHINNQYFVNAQPAKWDGNYYIWQQGGQLFAVSPNGVLYKQSVTGHFQLLQEFA